MLLNNICLGKKKKREETTVSENIGKSGHT